METSKQQCEELLDEYEILRRRTEPMRNLTSVTKETLAEVGVNEGDVRRLREVRAELELKCREYLPEDDNIDYTYTEGETP